MQTYYCNRCHHRFSSSRRQTPRRAKHLWRDYVFHKQTVRELAARHGVDQRGVRAILNRYRAPEKIHHPRPVHLLVDAVYFGERTEETSWCALVARDIYQKENLTWMFAETETTYGYSLLRERLEDLGYTVLSVTADGFSGIKSAFHGIPYQMCQVHMERLVIMGTTRHPLTEAGRVLRALARTLYETDSRTLHTRLTAYVEKYRDFLNEKTIHPLAGAWSWTHEGVRFALQSLLRNERYLFIFEHNKNIPRTTNALEGHFSHVRDVVEVHRGLGRAHKQRVLNSIFLASTIAPTGEKLDEIL